MAGRCRYCDPVPPTIRQTFRIDVYALMSLIDLGPRMYCELCYYFAAGMARVMF